MAERLDTTEKANAVHRRMLEAAAHRPHGSDDLAQRLRAGSEPPVAVCPPVVGYDAEFHARVADELALLSEASPIAEILSDYAVMRKQARACRGPPQRLPPAVYRG